MKHDYHYRLGNGANVRVWTNVWVGDIPLLNYMNSNATNRIDLSLQVKDIIIDGGWNLSYMVNLIPSHVVEMIRRTLLPHYSNLNDTLIWGVESSGKYVVSHEYQYLLNEARPSLNEVLWNRIWKIRGHESIHMLVQIMISVIMAIALDVTWRKKQFSTA